MREKYEECEIPMSLFNMDMGMAAAQKGAMHDGRRGGAQKVHVVTNLGRSAVPNWI